VKTLCCCYDSPVILWGQPRYAGAMGHSDVVRHKRLPHDVAHQRNMNTDLQLDSELVKCGVNLRMRQ
jgi:hypothetical protein